MWSITDVLGDVRQQRFKDVTQLHERSDPHLTCASLSHRESDFANPGSVSRGHLGKHLLETGRTATLAASVGLSRPETAAATGALSVRPNRGVANLSKACKYLL